MTQKNFDYDQHPDRFYDMKQELQEIAIEWVQKNLRPADRPLHGVSSYGLKHVLHSDIKLYMTNGEFKGAMLACGFKPVKPKEWNWYFRLDKRSPGLNLYRDVSTRETSKKLRQLVTELQVFETIDLTKTINDQGEIL